jgi:hypothetical protein
MLAQDEAANSRLISSVFDSAKFESIDDLPQVGLAPKLERRRPPGSAALLDNESDCAWSKISLANERIDDWQANYFGWRGCRKIQIILVLCRRD